MKSVIFSLALLLLPLGAAAQDAAVTPRFGTVQYEATLTAMPDYAAARTELDTLRAAYTREMERNESEFQRKFSEFLQGQKDFPTNIMQKRQKELQTLLEQSVAYREEVGRLLAEAEAEALAPVRQKLNDAIQRVGTQMRLSFIFNTDGGALPFVATDGEVVDVTPMVQEQLR